MAFIRAVIILAVATAVSACSTAGPDSRTTTERALIEAGGQMTAPSFDVRDVNVVVPRTLTVSEANRYYPTADIVWREDKGPDRYAQVEAIIEEAATRATRGLDGQVPVVVDIQIDRFHSLTEKARYSVGGVHNIIFHLGVRNATTDAFIVEPYRVEVDLQAYGGEQAIQAEREGQTQKVRIIDHMTEVIVAELGRPIPLAP